MFKKNLRTQVLLGFITLYGSELLGDQHVKDNIVFTWEVDSTCLLGYVPTKIEIFERDEGIFTTYLSVDKIPKEIFDAIADVPVFGYCQESIQNPAGYVLLGDQRVFFSRNGQICVPNTDIRVFSSEIAELFSQAILESAGWPSGCQGIIQ